MRPLWPENPEISEIQRSICNSCILKHRLRPWTSARQEKFRSRSFTRTREVGFHWPVMHLTPCSSSWAKRSLEYRISRERTCAAPRLASSMQRRDPTWPAPPVTTKTRPSMPSFSDKCTIPMATVHLFHLRCNPTLYSKLNGFPDHICDLNRTPASSC